MARGVDVPVVLAVSMFGCHTKARSHSTARPPSGCSRCSGHCCALVSQEKHTR